MKKFISMLLVLTMVVTTLMGIMVTDVSAGVTTSVDNSATPRTWTLTYDNSKDSRQIMATGKYILKPMTKGTTTDSKDSYDLGTITEANMLGMKGYRINFPITFTFRNGYKSSSSTYTRLQTTYSDAAVNATKPSETSSFSQGLTWANQNLGGDDGKAYRYTFYAYTKSTNSQELTLQLNVNRTGGAVADVKISNNELYSPEGVPHKVDLYIWSDSNNDVVFGSTTSNEYVYLAAVIDGNRVVNNAYARVAEINIPNKSNTVGTIEPAVYYSLSQGTGNSFKVTATDSYIFHPNAESGWVEVDKASISNDLFKTINLGGNTTSVTSTSKTGYIIGFSKYVTDLETALTNAEDKTTSSINIFASNYSSPASMYTDYEASNVKIVNSNGIELKEAEVSALTSLDNHYLKVNGVYVIPKMVDDPIPFVEGAGKPFKVGTHNTVVTRIRHENFIDNVNTGDAFGGLQNGFYRFTFEPRSGITFNNGDSTYNTNGYVAMKLYDGTNSEGIENNKEASYLTKYPVEKNIVTAEFDAYFPEYNTGAFRLGWALYDNGSKVGQTTINFNSSNIASEENDDIIDVEGNAWNRIALAFDMTDTVNDGIVDVKFYVNGVYQDTIYSKNVNLKDEAKTQFAPIGHLRFFSPEYASYATMGAGKWYVGEYTPSVPVVSNGEITAPNETVYVSEDDLIIASKLTDDELTDLMASYVPVYKNTYDKDVINAKYNEVDGTVTKLTGANLPEGAESAFKGGVIKKWIENSVHFKVSDGTDGKKVYELIDQEGERANISSATDNKDGTATIVFSGKFKDTTSYSGVCTGLPEIIALADGGVTKKLVGFAVVEEGKFPKVYTLEESGLNLRALTYNKETNEAELHYTKYGTDVNECTFKLIVGAYDVSDRLLALKSSLLQTLNSATNDGEGEITFEPKFDAETLSETEYYKVFMFKSLTNLVPIMPAVKVDK